MAVMLSDENEEAFRTSVNNLKNILEGNWNNCLNNLNECLTDKEKNKKKKEYSKKNNTNKSVKNLKNTHEALKGFYGQMETLLEDLQKYINGEELDNTYEF